jgi:hypothetical protein
MPTSCNDEGLLQGARVASDEASSRWERPTSQGTLGNPIAEGHQERSRPARGPARTSGQRRSVVCRSSKGMIATPIQLHDIRDVRGFVNATIRRSRVVLSSDPSARNFSPRGSRSFTSSRATTSRAARAISRTAASAAMPRASYPASSATRGIDYTRSTYLKRRRTGAGAGYTASAQLVLRPRASRNGHYVTMLSVIWLNSSTTARGACRTA